jgi:hypothetical protein
VLVMRNGKPAEALMAANSLLDRGWGKPTVPVIGEDSGPIVINLVKFCADDDDDPV